jgi:hypothetical protein
MYPRSPTQRWLIRLVLWLLPLYTLWWFGGGAEGLLRPLRLLADATLPHLFPQGVSEIVLQPDQSWKVRTGLVVQDKFPFEMAILFVSKTMLLRIVMGFPLLWGLILATRGDKFKRLVGGTVLLAAMCLIGIGGHIWALVAVVFNHQPSLIDDSLVPPPFRLAVAPYPQWLFHLSSFAHYLAILIVPIISPVLIWVMLCPRSVTRLVVSLRRNDVVLR